MSYEQLSEIENLTLDIMEAGHSLSESEAAELDGNGELREGCVMTEAVATSLRMERESVDVEVALAAFHDRIEGGDGVAAVPQRPYRGAPTPWRHRPAAVAAVLALAACVIGLVVLVADPGSVSRRTAAPLKPNQVYVAQEGSKDIIIKGGVFDETVITGRSTLKFVSLKALVPDLDTSHAKDLSLRVPDGKSLAFILPDGSHVWLHPGSTLYFPSRFDDDVRHVKLKGEAYFQVRHDAAHPFVVDAGGLRTTVLGTEFDINTEGKDGVAVVLVSGRVMAEAVGESRTLQPGTQAVAGNDGIAVTEIDTEKYTNWRDGYFYFDNETLFDILQEVGRSYGISINCSDTRLHSIRLRFIARRDDSLNTILQRLAELAPMHYKAEGKTLVVIPDK